MMTSNDIDKYILNKNQYQNYFHNFEKCIHTKNQISFVLSKMSNDKHLDPPAVMNTVRNVIRVDGAGVCEL